MSNVSQIEATVLRQEPPQYATIPSQSMASACAPAVDDVAKPPMVNSVATNIITASKASIRVSDAEASTIHPIATATSNPTVIRKDIQRTPVLTMTDDEVMEIVKKIPEEKPITQYYKKWQIPPGQSGAMERWFNFNHSRVLPSKEDCDLCLVIRMWPVWISEVEDDAVRLRLTEWILSAMAQFGMDPDLYARPLLRHRASSGPIKRGNRKEKIDDTLQFDDGIETSTIGLSKLNKFNYKITKKEFQETGASIEAVNLRIVTREVADGEEMFRDYLQIVENGRISVEDWKNRSDITAANPHGRDLLVYALHEVQIAKDEITQLKKYLPAHKSAAQKKNTNNRIADCTARINHWLALAVELDKVRPKDETDSNKESEAENGGSISPITIRDDMPSRIIIRDDTPSPASMASREEFVAPKSSATGHEDETKRREKVLQINADHKAPKDSFQDLYLVTRKTCPVQRVRLRPPKSPTDADGQQKQSIESQVPLPAVKQTKRKRKVPLDDDDSDGEFQVEGEVKPVTKRTKTDNEASKESPGEQYTVAPGGQQLGFPAPTQPSSTNKATHSTRALSETDKKSREIYLRKHFLPTVNAMLKKAGIGHIRSVPNGWDVIKGKLQSARVPPNRRNELLRDFKSGWTQTSRLESDQSDAAEPSNERASGGFFPAPSTSNIDSSPRDGLVVKLRAYEGFDPAEYSTNSIFLLPGFRYRYSSGSTVQDRIKWASIIEENVAATMRGEPPNGEWTRVYGQGKSIVNEWGALVAEGFWDEFDGAAAERGAWLWDGTVTVGS